MYFFALAVFVLLGLVIGSFLNVVVYRLNTRKSIGGRSACMSCRKTLAWYELIPVASFFALQGRCGGCSTRISWQYPVVEIISGAIFGLLFWKMQHLFFLNTLDFVFTYGYYTFIFSLLLVVSVYDIKHKIIPDSTSLLFGILAFVGMFFIQDLFVSFEIPKAQDFLAGAVLSVPFALLWLVSRGKAMGLGDAKLAVGMGFLLGVAGLLSATLIAFWAGAIIGVFLLLIKKNTGLKSEIPFGPFLVLGTFVAFVFGIVLFPPFF